VHLAAIENLLTQPVHYKKQTNYRKWSNVFRIRLRSTPKYYKQRYDFWDPLKGRSISVGKKLPVLKTVSTLTHERLNRKHKAKKIKLPKPNDAGLLKGVQLYDYQQEVFSKMLISQRAICSMVMGSGKAEPLTAKLLTPTGWTTMGEIKVGDFVIGSNGKPTKVTGVFPQGEKQIYKVTFTDGASTECCDEHLWAVRTPQQKFRKKGYQVKALSEIRHNLVDKQGNHRYHIPMVEPVNFTPSPVQLDPYLLGLLLGDGGFSNRKAVSFSTVDSFIVNEISNRLPCPQLRMKLKKNSQKDYYITKKKRGAQANKLLDLLRELDLSEKKSPEKHIPDLYKYNSVEIRLEVLRGLMDTDGFVDKTGKSTVFYSTSKQLADDVQEIVRSFGGKAVICNKQTHYTYKGRKKPGLPSFAVHISLPPKIIPVRLPRKQLRFSPRSKYEPTRYITKVEPLKKKLAQCIAVAARDHLYVTDDYIVTHNTLTTIACYAFIKKHTATRANPTTMLIVAPKSLRYQWGSEIKRTVNDDVYQLEKKADLLKAANHNIVVVTYQFLTRHFATLTKRKWTIAVVDEIQFIRNNTTKAWKALSKINASFIYGLSGTVIENRLGDLYSIMEIIQPGALGPLWKFNMNFQNLQIRSKTKLVYGGFKNLPALKLKLEDYVFSYDQLNLAPIQHHVTTVGMTKKQRLAHDDYRQKAKELIAKSLSGPISHYERCMVQAYMLKARQACNTHELLSKKRELPSAKIVAFLDLVKRVCVQSNEKLVVFSDWVEMLEICKRHIEAKYQLKTTMFTGKQSSKQRSAAVKNFQTDPQTMVFLASDAGGLGLDGLQLVSSNVVHTDIPWNPAKIDQRNGRLHRILQTTGVHVHYFVAKDTIEEHVHTLAKDKRNTRLKTLAEFAI